MFALGRTAAMATTTLVVLTSGFWPVTPPMASTCPVSVSPCHQKSGADDGIPPIIGGTNSALWR